MRGICSIFVVYVLICGLLSATTEATDVTVVTDAGTFIGYNAYYMVDSKHTKLSEFLGIPYAEAPVGNLRFMKPIQKKTFSEPKEVKSYGIECLQLALYNQSSLSGSEDCLFLDVFVPQKKVKSEKLAVMVYIHGGSFQIGSGSNSNPVILALYGHSIIVTFNYRLGVLGYLSTEDSNSSGNFGLWDQRLAIQWVKENIEAFGGDQSRITLFGESAGAASVVYQGTFPGNKGMFNRIIAQSGSSTVFWAIQNHPKQNAIEFSKLSGCKNDTENAMVDCLRRLPLNILKSVIKDFDTDPFMNPTFLPSTDYEFVSCSPRDIFNISKNTYVYQSAREVFASFDFMSGINSGEGGIEFIPENGVLDDPDLFLPNKTYFDDVLVPICVRRLYGDNLIVADEDAIFQNVINKYTDPNEPNNPLSIRELFADMYTDALYLAPMQTAVDTHVEWSTKGTYMYFFDMVPSDRLYPAPSWFKRANHADELLYLFPETLPLYGFSKEENVLSKLMIKMWTNFARTGNPNSHDLNFEWQNYTARDERYLAITLSMDPESSKKNLGKDKARFWINLFSYPEEPCTFKGNTDDSNIFKMSAGVTVLCIVISLYIY